MTLPRRVRVSICAVRNLADVRAVVDGGADACGVLVGVRHRAEDAVSLAVAARLLDAVPPYVGRYAVTHARDLAELRRITAALPVDTLQLHDDVAPGVARALRGDCPGLRLLKAVHVRGQEVDDVSRWRGVVHGLILDSVDEAEDRIGGTGRIHDWSVSAAVVQASTVPVVLAGGLTPDNVAAAVAAVEPWAVNVNSGVEVAGAKSRAAIEAFVQAANQARLALVT